MMSRMPSMMLFVLALTGALGAAAGRERDCEDWAPICGRAPADVKPEFRSSGGTRSVGAPFASRSQAISTKGMAATAQPLATKAALDMLEKGGSAVDGAIAANAMLAVVEPYMNGPGGDLMAMIWQESSGELHGYNGGGRAPLGYGYDHVKRDLDALGTDVLPVLGPLPVIVPGAPRGWCDVHSKFGKLPLAQVLDPAIRVAREGFPVTEIIAGNWPLIENSSALTSNGAFPDALLGFLRLYTLPADDCTPNCGLKASQRRVPREGEIMTNPVIAQTLQKLGAAGGCEEFYAEDGFVARELESFAAQSGVHITGRDLAAHRGEWVTPLSTTYRERYEVFELPPNPQGVAVLEWLNMLDLIDLSEHPHNSAEYLHLQTELKKLVFSDASEFVADPDFASIPLEGLLSREYAAARLQRFRPFRAARVVPPGNPVPFCPDPAACRRGASELEPVPLESLREADTTYLTVADGEGNMVSFIQSLYTQFGSGLVPPTLGFALQSRGALFSMDKSKRNVYASGKRPYHTIIPGFVKKDGKPWLSFGVMGGFMQPQGHVQILSNLIDFGMKLQEAGDAARFEHLNSTSPSGAVFMTDGGTLAVEGGVCETVVKQLQALGHTVIRESNSGGFQGILRDDHINEGKITYFGATEFRKDGIALGL